MLDQCGNQSEREREREREIYMDSSHGGLMTMAGVQNPIVQNQPTKNLERLLSKTS